MTQAETVQLLSWVSRQPRTYAEAIEVWRTNCPQHSLWEDAIHDGLVQVLRNGSAAIVALTPRGEAVLTATSGVAGDT